MVLEKRRERNKRKKVINNILLVMSMGVGIVYFILLFKIVLFKYVGIESVLAGSFDSELRSVNFIPFRDLGFMLSGDGIHGVIKNYGGNMGLFFPLGILVPLFLKKIHGWRVIAGGFILSLFFEITQYILCLGASDIDDLFMNTIGCAFGYFVYYIVNRKTTDILKIRFKSLLILCVVGTLGIAVVYEMHPTSIMKQERIEVNKEILGNLSKEADFEGIMTKIEDGRLYVETYADTDENNNEIPSEKYDYTITDDTKFYCKEIEGTYNAGGNVTKVTVIYSQMNYEEFIDYFNTDERKSADIWLDGDNIKALMITEHTRAE